MSATQTVHTCPDCDKTYPTTQGLGAHRFRAHGIKGTSKKAADRRQQGRRVLPVLTPRQAATHPAAVSPFVERTQVLLDDLADPLRDQLDAIASRLSDLDNEANELRKARTRINGVLMRLDPDAVKLRPTAAASEGRANGARALANQRLQEKAEAVRAIITKDPRFADGFTSNLVAHELTTVIPHGLSTKSAREILEMLRDQSVVRHDRVVKGGGMQFKLVTSLNGDSADG